MRRVPLWALGAILLAGLLVAPTLSAQPTTVLTDPTGDVEWTVLWWPPHNEGPEELEPVRDAAFDHNGSSADVEKIWLGENETHVVVEADLRDMLPEPRECKQEPFVYRSNCADHLTIYWTYVRQQDPWAPEIKLEWDMTCMGDCADVVMAQIGDAHGLADRPGGDLVDMLDHRRVEPDRVQWTLDKRAFQKADEIGSYTEPNASRLCRGDAFVDFRFITYRWDGRVNVAVNEYRDNTSTRDSGLHRIQHDSPQCPESTASSSGVDGLKTVLSDRTNDTASDTLGRRLAMPQHVKQTTDAVRPNPADAADARAIRVGETKEAVVVEFDVTDRPRVAAPECPAGGVPADRTRCSFHHQVEWVYYRPTDPWGPRVQVMWNLTCKETCDDHALVRVGDQVRFTDASPWLDFEEVSETTGRWRIAKRAFQKHTEMFPGDAGEPAPARMCAGDVLANFRFTTRSRVRMENDVYFDSFHTPPGARVPSFETGSYRVQDDGPRCPAGVSSAGGVHPTGADGSRPGSGDVLVSGVAGEIPAWALVVGLGGAVGMAVVAGRIGRRG